MPGTPAGSNPRAGRPYPLPHYQTVKQPGAKER